MAAVSTILNLLKSLISLARLDRFLPNFAGRRIEATNMFPMSFLTSELDPNDGTADILDLLKSLISPERLDEIPRNFAGRRVKAIVYIIRVKRCDQMHFGDRCDQMHFRTHLVTQSS